MRDGLRPWGLLRLRRPESSTARSCAALRRGPRCLCSFLNASGCLGRADHGAGDRRALLDVFVTKTTVTPEPPREGNPLGADRRGGSGDAQLDRVGEPGPRAPPRARRCRILAPRSGSPIWVSVGGFSADDYAETCRRAAARSQVALTLELNLSCPNVDEAAFESRRRDDRPRPAARRARRRSTRSSPPPCPIWGRWSARSRRPGPTASRSSTPCAGSPSTSGCGRGSRAGRAAIPGRRSRLDRARGDGRAARARQRASDRRHGRGLQTGRNALELQSPPAASARRKPGRCIFSRIPTLLRRVRVELHSPRPWTAGFDNAPRRRSLPRTNLLFRRGQLEQNGGCLHGAARLVVCGLSWCRQASRSVQAPVRSPLGKRMESTQAGRRLSGCGARS